MGRRDWIVAVALSAVVAALTALPYLLAQRLAGPGGVFSGFLINPIDGFSYLAKMRQGAEGAWQFHLPYASDPGPGAYLFLYHLALGHLSMSLNLPPLILYHAARVLSAFMMVLLAFAFFDRLLDDPLTKWTAYLLAIVGSGLGWLGIPFGLLSNDLWIPEAIPFLTAYSNAHFPVATALMLTLVLILLADGHRRVTRLLGALFSGMALAIIQPFAVLSLGFVIASWLVVEGVLVHRDACWPGTRSGIWVLLAFGLGSAPWMLYDYWLTRSHPVLRVWNAQNLTPSPPPLETALGYGLTLVFALLAVALRLPHKNWKGRLLLVWVIVQGVLLYAPFSLQRRFSLGLYFPLAALAAMGLSAVAQRNRRKRLASLATILLAVPSNLIVVGAGLGGVIAQDPALVLAPDEVGTYSWLDRHLADGALVLAGPQTGNRIPAFADVRVIYGHPFETPHAVEEEAFVESLFSWEGPQQEALSVLEGRGVQYVVYGPRERALGTPAWLEDLELLTRIGSYQVYRVSDS